MIPEATILVIGHNDYRARPQRASFDLRNNVGDVLVARLDVGVAGMLGLGTNRLVERHRRQAIALDRLDKVGLILQVFALGLGAVRVLLEVSKGLVRELE